VDELRHCTDCDLPKPESEFAHHSRGQRKKVCKVCAAARLRAWREANKDHVREYHREYQNRPDQLEKRRAYNRDRYHQDPLRARENKLRKAFGISLTEYDQMLEAQGGVCAICHKACKSGRELAVDHDHETGEVRALLCMNCNRAIGWLQDNPDLVMAAADYLLRYRNVLRGLG
jgi:hypothetical protein